MNKTEVWTKSAAFSWGLVAQLKRLLMWDKNYRKEWGSANFCDNNFWGSNKLRDTNFGGQKKVWIKM